VIRRSAPLLAFCATWMVTACVAGLGCGRPAPAPPPEGQRTQDRPADGREAERSALVAELAGQGIKEERVLAALRKVPRHEFVPESFRHVAYENHPLPIGEDQTISQPYIVALMTELAAVDAKSRVLEVGTGSGYQAAILAELAGEVYSIEIIEPLARQAAETLRRLGYDRIHLRTGDGYRGWPEAAPFDAIVVTAAPTEVPAPLRDQLKPSGRLVIPVGDEYQELRVITKTTTGFDERTIIPVRFVPMTGESQNR
jgi:protein-L-isoaspartate(D-aspartate) O-methyltransferase